MSNPPKSRSIVTWGLAAVVLVTLVLVLVLDVPGWRRGPDAPEAPDTGAAPDVNTSGGQGGLASTAGGPPGSEGPARMGQDIAPMIHCWGELQRLDQALTLDNFRAHLASVLPSEDRFLLTYLHERLTRMVGDDARNALEVLSWAEAAGGGAELVVYMEALKKAPAVHHPQVAERLLQLAENPEGPMALRAASMVALETQKHFEPASLDRLKAVALDGTADQTAWLATRTIGRVMEEDFKSTGRYAPYWEHLLEISRKSEDRAVRGLALEMPTYPELILGAESIDALGEIMRTDRDAEIREYAAMRLSVTEAPEKALEAYREAFATETEFCVRWALFRYALRAAGPAALPLVARFAQQEPRLQEDYLEFKDIYAQGTADWERVFYAKKPSHIECMESHAEGQ